MSDRDSPQPFSCSHGGRLATATGGVATLGAGVLALMGPGPLSPIILSIVTLLCIGGFLFAVGLATEKHGAQALVMILALPFLGGVYVAALTFADRGGPALGLALVAFSVAAFGRAMGLRAPQVEEARQLEPRVV